MGKMKQWYMSLQQGHDSQPFNMKEDFKDATNFRAIKELARNISEDKSLGQAVRQLIKNLESNDKHYKK